MSLFRPATISALLLLIIGCSPTNSEADNTGDRFFEAAAISLMPEGEPDNLEAFMPLNPTIIAWGNDPIGSNLDVNRYRVDIDKYFQMGLKWIASNVWMLTATASFLYNNPEYQQAVCVDIKGEAIVPRWLDNEYKGIKPYWGCTNNPLYRSHLKKRAEIGLLSGANMLHLDDHMGTCAAASHSGGCFCSYCLEGFEKWLKNNVDPSFLDSLQIKDLDHFSYLEHVLEAGIHTREEYIAKASRRVPLFHEFLSFQRYAAAEFIRELGEMADSLTGKGIPIGVNAWNLIPQQLATSHYADYFSNEVSHHGVEDLVPPFVYLLGNALGMPVFSTGTGEDWIRIGEKEEPVRVSRWIATAYAFGNYFMYSYNKWGFSEETGTRWYQIPIEMYEPICTFINDNPGLFNNFEPYASVAVFYDNAAVERGASDPAKICRQLHQENIPVALVVQGDQWLKFNTPANNISEYEYLVIPEGSIPGEGYSGAMEKFKSSDHLIRVNPGDPISIDLREVQVENEENIWTIPRIRNSTGGSELAIHLLNQDYVKGIDRMDSKKEFIVKLSGKLADQFRGNKIKYFAPGKEPLELTFSKNRGEITITVPSLDVWGIIYLKS